jgi:uncharacterized oligopeptide transporter (OPT) family protein
MKPIEERILLMKDIDRFDEDVRMNPVDQKCIDRQKRTRARIKQALMFTAQLFLFHLIVLLFYSLFVNTTIKTEIYHESGLERTILLVFSLFVTALFAIISGLQLAGDGAHRRAFSQALADSPFIPLLPLSHIYPKLAVQGICYLAFQLPFVLFHLALGFYYPQPTAIEKFYSMDAGLMEWTRVGILGAILNTLLFLVVTTLVRYLIYCRWNKEKI